MIARIINSNAAAIALQQAAELRRNQSANSTDTKQSGAQSSFAEIFGRSFGDAAEDDKASLTATARGRSGISTSTDAAIVMDRGTPEREPAVVTIATTEANLKAAAAAATTPSTTAATTTAATSAAAAATSTTAAAAFTGTSAATATTAATTTTPAAATTAAATVTNPGVEALVTAIMNGSFKATYVTNPSQLQETTPIGTDTMPNFYYASDETAAQLAQLLGGTVVQRPAFGQDQGWSEPNANFIQLPNGQTFNAADVAYYAQCGSEGAAQLTADITGSINEGSAWTNYYQQGGQMPTFPEGYVGPAITGMSYPSSMVDASGNVINPAMQQSGTQGT